MPFTYIRRAAIAVALTVVATAGCTVKNSEQPPLTGPSGLALSLTVSATPDSISQDGGSQSTVRVTAIGPNGQPISGLPLRIDMLVGNVPQDFGTLSARSIVTNSNGIATVTFTAPPSPVNGIFGTCSGLPGNCVTIVATPTSTNFASVNPEQVSIRLVPTGVILPPGSTPTAAFTFSPTPVNFNVPVIFDASSSCGGTVVSGVCTSSSAISTYAWNFGDGTTGSGKTVTHTFSGSGTSFSVTLTVTNDRGLSNSTTQTVAVSASASPSGDWVFSPTQPAVGDVIFFNATGVRAATGHTMSQFSWSFGDGVSATGVQVTHIYTVAASYVVVLNAIDDAGQSTVLTKTIIVGSGNPNASVIVTKAGGLSVRADAGGSTSANGSTITNYTFFWGDGTSDSGTPSVQSHAYASPGGTFQVSVRVTDSLGRTGSSAPSPITVP